MRAAGVGWAGEPGKETRLLRELLWLKGHGIAAASALNANDANYYANLQLLSEPATWVAFLTPLGLGKPQHTSLPGRGFLLGRQTEALGEEPDSVHLRDLPLEVQFALP